MNRDRIEGHWKQVTGNARQSWAKLIGDPLGIITGIRQHQAGKTQEAFGISKTRRKQSSLPRKMQSRKTSDAAIQLE